MVRIGMVSTMERIEEIPRDNRYRLAVERAGAEACWLPWSTAPEDWQAWAEKYDGFLFTGGGDMDPKYYGQAMDARCGVPNPKRDEMEMGLILKVLSIKKPILGICRGFQTINIALGGTLYQDLPLFAEGHSDDAGRDTPSHPAEIFPGTKLAEILGAGEIMTNSVHHQAVNRVGRELSISARSRDGIAEGLESPKWPFLLGVQFHPEATAGEDPRMQGIFDAFVAAARKEKEKTMQEQYILFDLDGTLTDPGLGLTNSVGYALEKFGIHEENREKLYPFIGPPLLDSFMKFYGMTRAQAEQGVLWFREYFAPKGIFENVPYEGIGQVLAGLKAKGLHLAVATSKPEEYAKQILAHFDLAQYFDRIAGSTMDETRTRKGEVIAYALDQLPGATPSNTVMVGDREYDVLGARENGLPCVGVLFGYGSRDELEAAGAAEIAETVEDLGKILGL